MRWRLHNALAELRSQLEKHYGERGQDWRLVLLPLGPGAGAGGGAGVGAGGGAGGTGTSPPAGRVARRNPALLLGAFAAAVLIVLLGAAIHLGAFTGGGGAVAETAAAADSVPAGGSRRPRRPAGRGPSTPVLSAAVLARACPDEVAALESRLAEARRALAYYLPPRTAFHDNGAANPIGLAALAPIMNRWLDEHGAPRHERAMKCQGDACKIKVTEPWPVPAPWVDRPPSSRAAADLERIARNIVLEGPVEERDVSPSVAETWVWLRLRALDGRPADAPAPPFPPSLLPSASRNAASVSGRGEACRNASAPLEGEIESLRLRAEKEMLASLLYEKETTSNPELAARLQPLVDRAHRHRQTPEADRATPLAVACRGLVCKVEPPAGVLVKSETMKVLLEERELASQVRRVSLDNRNGRAITPLYFTVMRPPSESRSGGDMLRHFIGRTRQEDVFGRCQQKAPGRGKLSFQLFCPAEGESNQDGIARRISFRLGESLADAPFGRCVAEELTRRAAAFELPPDLTRAEADHTIEVP